MASGNIVLLNGLNNLSERMTVVARAKCYCGKNSKLFEADHKYAKAHWPEVNDLLFSMGNNWLGKLKCCIDLGDDEPS